jgi:O-antigen ligase/tetratricopeptide (TPR) repeat protein
MAQAIVGLVLLAIAGFFSPYLTFALVSVFVIFESQTRGTMIGLLIGLAVACVCQALYANGTGYKKTLVALTYPLILALYALFVLALNSFSLSLWYLYWIGVAYLIGLIVYVAMNSAAVQNKSVRMGRWVSVSILALAFIGIGVFFLIKDAQFIKNSPSLDRIASISLTDTKTQARAYIWPMALKGFTQRPILGWGQENFNYIFNANYNPKMWSQEQWFDRAHSVYLDWLVASGGVGLIVYLSLYILIVLAVWKSSLSVTQKSVLTGLVAGYAIHNFFVFDNLASYVFFFALLGFAGSLSIPAIDSKKTSRVFSFDLVEYVVMPISIIALVAGVYFLNIRPIQANVRLIAALKSCTNQTQLPDPSLFTKALSVSAMANQEIREQVLSCAGGIIARGYPGTTKQAFYDLALQQIKAQTDSAPRDARMYVLGGMFLSNINQLAEALPILEKAHELTPNKQTASIQLATAYINMNRNEEALTLLKNAYEADPTFPDARSAYVLGLVLSNRDADARALASTMVSMFENERVARAYASIKQYDKSIAMFKKLLAADPKSVPLRVQLAEVYASANMKWMAVDLIRAIGKDYPEYKDQVEAAVKQIQDAPVK